jgi:hypothetical protein
MNKKIFGVILAVVLVFSFSSCGIVESKNTSGQITDKSASASVTSSSVDTIKIMSWNLQVFGTSKASKPAKMKIYEDTMKNYDVVFVEEIRDSSDTAFKKLCSGLPGYDCNCSSRAGNSTSKEQYGVIYKKGIKLDNIKDFNPDSQGRWERPPAAFTLSKGNYVFTVYVMHTKPENTPAELKSLETVVSNKGNVIVLGDLNADCNYYHNTNSDFKNWTWLIKDNIDTTTGATDCAYDRIIVNSDENKEVIKSGVVNVVNVNGFRPLSGLCGDSFARQIILFRRAL